MKNLIIKLLLSISLAFTPLFSFAQNKPDTLGRAGRENVELKGDQTPAVLQLKEEGATQATEIDRALLEIQFNQMIDEIDLKYHTPPALQSTLLFGYHNQASTPGKGKTGDPK